MKRFISAAYLIVPALPLMLMLSVPLGVNLKSDFGAILIITAWLLALAFLFLYIRHVRKNQALNRGAKPLWVLILLLFGPFSSMAYWNSYMRKSL